MPELPEVETILRGIQPFLENQIITKIIFRCAKLRWPIPEEIAHIFIKQKITKITRRAKYLLFHTQKGSLIIHLGMSGNLRILKQNQLPTKHDHVDIQFKNGIILRFNDPRRFGALLWTSELITQHILFSKMGVEPLSKEFNATYLFQQTRSHKTSIKQFLMNNQCVVGVGNIYSAEALFAAGINPKKPANQLDLTECKRLVNAVKKILRNAIAKGGTTLKDFSNAHGKPGYFKLTLKVYGRAGLACVKCHNILVSYRQGQRSTVYCRYCQS